MPTDHIPKHAALRCHHCGGTDIRVSQSAQKRRRNGRTRLHADCRCQDKTCKHQFWSVHEEALRRSRAADQRASVVPPAPPPDPAA